MKKNDLGLSGTVPSSHTLPSQTPNLQNNTSTATPSDPAGLEKTASMRSPSKRAFKTFQENGSNIINKKMREEPNRQTQTNELKIIEQSETSTKTVGLESYIAINSGEIETHALMGCSAIIVHVKSNEKSLLPSKTDDTPPISQEIVLLGHFGNFFKNIEAAESKATEFHSHIAGFIASGNEVNIWVYARESEKDVSALPLGFTLKGHYDYSTSDDDFDSYSLKASIKTINDGPIFYRNTLYF